MSLLDYNLFRSPPEGASLDDELTPPLSYLASMDKPPSICYPSYFISYRTRTHLSPSPILTSHPAILTPAHSSQLHSPRKPLTAAHTYSPTQYFSALFRLPHPHQNTFRNPYIHNSHSPNSLFLQTHQQPPYTCRL